MAPTSDYKRAYEAAREELSDLLAQQEKIEKRLVLVRQSLQTLATLCENEGVQIEPSAEAAYFLENSPLAVEIRRIMGASHYDKSFRPSEIKSELERLGHDLSQYQNPQSTIHMVLKRLADSEEIQERKDIEGKLIYRMHHPLVGGKLRPDDPAHKLAKGARFGSRYKPRYEK
jgi:hypothetical protein